MIVLGFLMYTRSVVSLLAYADDFGTGRSSVTFRSTPACLKLAIRDVDIPLFHSRSIFGLKLSVAKQFYLLLIYSIMLYSAGALIAFARFFSFAYCSVELWDTRPTGVLLFFFTFFSDFVTKIIILNGKREKKKK